MQLAQDARTLTPTRIAFREPSAQEVLLRVLACGVCRTDQHIVDGELPARRRPIVPGHEIVGRVVSCGAEVDRFAVGQRVGVPWLASTCGECAHCCSGRENLCQRAQFTGYDVDGGYAEFVLADARYCLEIPKKLSDTSAAPLLCAGLIGYRALRAAGDARRIGLYGFGAAAHIVAQVAAHEGREVFALTRPGDSAAQALARRCGAVWAGSSVEAPPEPLDAALIFAPVGALVPGALRAIDPGGIVVCAGIHMSDIPAFPYRDLWGERTLRSIANLTRRDGTEFMQLAERAPLTIDVTNYQLLDANRALDDLRSGSLRGAAVLSPSG